MKKLLGTNSVLPLMMVLAMGTSAHAIDATPNVVLPATDKTTWVGYFDNSRAPVLAINSGDVLETQTWSLYNDNFKPGVTMEQILTMRKRSSRRIKPCIRSRAPCT